MYLQNFDNEDLISFESKEKIFRIHKLNAGCHKSIESFGKTAEGFSRTLSETLISSREWMDQGVDCEILRLGEKQWTKGKIKARVIIEFNPELEAEPSSDLDVFREEEDGSWPPTEI